MTVWYNPRMNEFGIQFSCDWLLLEVSFIKKGYLLMDEEWQLIGEL